MTESPFPVRLVTRRENLAALAGLVLSVPGPVSAQPAPGSGRAAPTGTVVARTIVARPGSLRLLPDPADETPAWLYDVEGGQPVIRMKRGTTLVLTLLNQLPEPTSLHVYGMRGANAADGVVGLTQQAVAPGGSHEYRLSPTDAGTFWFHPFVPGRTAEQVERGLSGVLVVEEETPQPVDIDLAVVVDDWRLEAATLDQAFGSALDAATIGRLGNLLTVNRRPAPDVVVSRPGARLRLRFVNVANARILPLRFERQAAATVIAIDGQPCEPFDPLRKQVVLAPGSRYDVMLDLSRESGVEARVVAALGSGLPLLRLTTEGDAGPGLPPVRPLPGNDLPAAIRLQAARRADFTIGGGLPDRTAPGGAPPDAATASRLFPNARAVWTLNGAPSPGFSGKPLLSVRRGSVCVIALANTTIWPHVIHVHGHVFRLLHPLDDGWEPYFLDTIVVPERRTYRIAFEASNPGRWAIRSSVLEHMESGLLSWFEVT